MYEILTIFLILSVSLRQILRIFESTDLGICEQKVRNFSNNIKRLHCGTVHTMGNFTCNTLLCYNNNNKKKNFLSYMTICQSWK